MTQRPALRWGLITLAGLLAAAYWWWDASTCGARALRGLSASDDFVNIATYAAKCEDPALYPRDYLFRLPQAARIYTPSYLVLLRALRSERESWEEAVVRLVPVLAFAYFISTTALLLAFTRRAFIAAAIAGLTMVPHQTITCFWGVGSAGEAMPRTVFGAVAPLLLLFYLRHRLAPPGRLAAFFFVGMAANLHPVSGAVLVQILLIDSLFDAARERRFLRLPAEMLAFAAGAAPFLLAFFGPKEGIPTPTWSTAEFFDALRMRFGRNLLPPTSFNLLQFAEAAVPLIPLALAGAVFALRRQAINAPGRRVVRLLLLVLVWVPLGTAILEGLASQFRWRLLTIDQLRGLRFVFPLLYCLFALGWDRAADRLPRAGSVVLLLLAPVMLLPLVRVQFLAVSKAHVPEAALGALNRLRGRAAAVSAREPESLREAADWARGHTAADALFLATDGRFRLWSGRSVAFSFKDGGTCYYLGEGVFEEWARRAHLVRDRADDPAKWLALAAELDCDYALIDKSREPRVAGAVFENDRYAVVPVPERQD